MGLVVVWWSWAAQEADGSRRAQAPMVRQGRRSGATKEREACVHVAQATQTTEVACCVCDLDLIPLILLVSCKISLLLL